MPPSSNVPGLSYESIAGEMDAGDDEFAAQLEGCLVHSPAETELPVVDLADYATPMMPPEPSDDLEGSIINIFQHLSAPENGVVDDLFADSVQSSDDVEDVGLDFSTRGRIDHWIGPEDMAECSYRSSSSRKRSYSEADPTSNTKLKAGVTAAFGDHWSFGGSSPVEGDDIPWETWPEEDGQESFMNSRKRPKFESSQSTLPFGMNFPPDSFESLVNKVCKVVPLETWDPDSSQQAAHEYQWHDNNYSFSAAMISAMSPVNEDNRSATSDALSCSGQCSSSGPTHEVDWEEMVECLPKVQEDQMPAPCDVDAVQRRPSEREAPQQRTGIKRKEKTAVNVSAPKYRGVVYNINTRKWEAHVWNPSKQMQTAASRGKKKVKAGMQVYLGQYHTCEEAATVHDRAAIKMGLTHDSDTDMDNYLRPSYPLNFEVEAYDVEVLEHRGWSVRDYLWKLRKGGVGFSRGSSAMKGVTWKKKLNKFEARYSWKDGGVKREFNLGLFDDEEVAGRHYDLAILSFKGAEAITNFRPSEYSEAEIAEYGRNLVEKKY